MTLLMKPTNTIYGLHLYGLTPSTLARLGATPVRIEVMLDTYRITPALRRLRPEQRGEFLKARAAKMRRAVERKWPFGKVAFDNRDAVLSRMTTTVRAKDVATIAALPGRSFVTVERIQGRRRKPYRRGALEYYCVRAKVAIQIEGQTRGTQEWEDRFVLVRATGHKDAIRRLRKEWVRYAEPGINRDNQLFRYQLEKVVDVYYTCEQTIDPNGSEVFSVFHERRMKPEYVWRGD